MGDRRGRFVLAEALEPRRLLTQILIDNGPPSETSTDGIEPALRVNNRWTTTASGSVGSNGTGVTLTWSIVPDGTTISSGFGEPAAASDLQARLNALYGSALEWMPLFQQAFDYWSSISGVTFVQDNDDGVATGGFFTEQGVLGTRGDIRIGAHPIDGALNTVAYNWYPDRGDMVIDSGDLFGGGALTNLSNNSRLLKNVVAHELGHGLGFDHVGPRDGTKLMEAVLAGNFDGPQFDDLYTVNRSYGDAFEKSGGNNSAATATNRGVIGGTTDFIDKLSLATFNDVDVFKFTLDSARNVTITVSPFGPTYLEGPDAGPYASFNAMAQMDLQVQLVSSDGTTVLSTANAGGVGANEVLSSSLAAGNYYIKVSAAPGAPDRNQMYTLSNVVSGTAVISTTVALSGGNDLMITDIAAGGKPDALSVTADTPNSRFVISDPVNFLGTSIAGASGNGMHTVTVPFFAVSGGDVLVNLLGGNDAVSVSSGAMPVTIDGGAGTDTVNIVETSGVVPAVIVASVGDDTINVNADGAGVARATLAVSQTIGTLSVGAGGRATLAGVAGGLPEVLVIKNFLKLSGGGQLDVQNNDVALGFYSGSSPIGVVSAGDYSGVLGLVQDGRAGGTWTGGGLITTQALAAGAVSVTSVGVAQASQTLGISGNATAVFDGQTIDASTVLVRYTFAGDADLNLDINGDDFFNIDTGIAGASPSWFNGDFNYSGKVDADDYFLIDSNYNKDSMVLGSEVAGAVVFAKPQAAERRLIDELL